MDCNLLEGFSDWMKQQFNVDADDFAKIGDIVLANITLTPDNGKEPITYKTATQFELLSNNDGTVYKLRDNSHPTLNDRQKSLNPYVGASQNAGRTYTLSKSEYEKLLLFPKQPMAAAGLGNL